MKITIIVSALLLLTVSGMSQQQPCGATTKAGTPCKSTIVLKDGKCRAHSTSTPRCAGQTSKGKPCGMAVKTTGEYCRFHKK